MKCSRLFICSIPNLNINTIHNNNQHFNLHQYLYQNFNANYNTNPYQLIGTQG